ncbi:ATP-binding protein [Aneurinibacillus terranovensis]|uniref:ATP-binding protein n=1 Tax=Aneurinibacillus terranovensis TaxID=278991 RepID=UPI0004036FD3|nr:ATP-binding protein [Aneurinibacillus terranovensis]
MFQEQQNELKNINRNKKDLMISRLASIGQISAGIAHEVKNPLTSVKGFLQMLKEEAPHRYLDIAASELEQALSTLHNLLQVSKPDLDDEPYVRINLCSELESLIYLFQDQSYRIQVKKFFSDTHESIFGKRSQLKRAFFNVLKNAFEAIPETGVITLEHYRSGPSVYITIKDTGTGISEEKLHMLGTPFFTTKNEGTGMGLTQVFSTIYQHGGKINVESKEGMGTTFVIEFPISVQQHRGVIDLNLQYEGTPNFKEFYSLNKDRLNKLIEMQGKEVFGNLEDFDESFVHEAAYSIVEVMNEINEINEINEHAFIVLAKKHGENWAKHDFTLLLKLEWFQMLRKLYWDFLYNYHKNTEFSMQDFFELERKINFNFDSYIKHFASSFSAYKNKVIESQREVIEDLAVTVIPLSKSMAILPIVGTVDTYRAKKIQEHAILRISSLKLKRIIIDLSGVAFIDTSVVTHLFRIVEGISLLGCKTVLCGIRPEIVNTLIELGISLTEKIETVGTLQQALEEYSLTGEPLHEK